jgi:hypothetical protein
MQRLSSGLLRRAGSGRRNGWLWAMTLLDDGVSIVDGGGMGKRDYW